MHGSPGVNVVTLARVIGSLALATKVRSVRFQLRAASLLAAMNVPAPGGPVPEEGE